MPLTVPSGSCWPTSRSTTTIRANLNMNIVYHVTTSIITTITTCEGTTTNTRTINSVEPAGTYSFTIVYNKEFLFGIETWTNNRADYETDFAEKMAPYNQEVANSQSFILNPGQELSNTFRERVCQTERKCNGVIVRPEIRTNCGQSVWKRITKQVGLTGVRVTSGTGNCMLD